MRASATYKLLRHVGGRCSFAEVEVALAPQSDAAPILEGVGPNGDYSDWIAAARVGIARAQQRALDVGKPIEEVTLVRLRGTIVDSTSEAVRCAAEAATLKVLGWREDDLVVQPIGNSWTVDLIRSDA